jgi:hypothetical protein
MFFQESSNALTSDGGRETLNRVTPFDEVILSHC